MSKASDSAYARIRDRIMSGSLGPGAHLKEEELTALTGVSRTSVRDALRRLEADFFVRRTETGRVFVPDWSMADIEEVFRLRALLEAEAAANAAERASAADIAALRQHHEAIGQAFQNWDVPSFLAHNREFHRIILNAAASSRLNDLLARIVAQPIVFRTAQSYTAEDLRRSHQEHADMLQAIEARDAAWARAVMTAHIRRAFQRYQEAYRRQAVTLASAAE
jgi:DNA-binding GntR family transcriptional regulator